MDENWKLAPVRGEFHDYFGKVIAGNFESYQLHIIPEQVLGPGGGPGELRCPVLVYCQPNL